MNTKDKKKLLLAAIEDSVANIFYYDRKDDSELTREDIEHLLDKDLIIKQEILDTFDISLEQYLNF